MDKGSPPRSVADLQTALARLPTFYGHREVLELCFQADRDKFLQAYIDGSLPPEVRAACEETLGYQTLTAWLLRELIRRLPPPPQPTTPQESA